MLRELYTALVAPVEEHLTGIDEVLIMPHMELFEVPWAALIDAHGLRLYSYFLFLQEQIKGIIFRRSKR